MTCFRIKHEKYTVYDTAALISGVLLLVYFLCTARLGFNGPDEGLYYTIAQRILQGERLFLEEWNLTQLASLFAVVPFWIYKTVTGGVEGLILFMRYVFIVVDGLFYVFMYLKLRAYRIWGLLSAFLFCAIVPEAIFALDYYTVSAMAVMAVCLILFADAKKKSPVKLVFAGVIFAFAVLAEPVLILMYAAFSVGFAVWRIGKKKRRTQTDASPVTLRAWLYITVGAFLVFIAFIALLLHMGSLQGLRVTLPYLLNGADINVSTVTDLSNLLTALRSFGYVNLAGLLLCIGAAVYYCVSGRKSVKLKMGVFLCSLLFFCGCCVCAAHAMLAGGNKLTAVAVLLSHGLPVSLAAPVWYLLLRNKTPRIFAVWLVSAVYTVLVDTVSNVMVAAGGRIALVSALLILGALLPELKEDIGVEWGTRGVFRAGRIRAKRLFYAGVAVFAAVFAVWNFAYIGVEGFFHTLETSSAAPGESPYAVTLQSGPQKGVKTSRAVADGYDATLRDIDAIVREAHGAPIYINILAPYLYLHAGLPYGNFSAWDDDSMERRLLYWKLFPAQTPGYIYLPAVRFTMFYADAVSEEYLESQIREIEKVFVCETVKGERGYILKVLGYV